MFPTVDNFQRQVCPQELSFGMIVFREERQFDASDGTTDRTHFTQDPAGSVFSPASYPERNGAVFGTEC